MVFPFPVYPISVIFINMLFCLGSQFNEQYISLTFFESVLIMYRCVSSGFSVNKLTMVMTVRRISETVSFKAGVNE